MKITQLLAVFLFTSIALNAQDVKQQSTPNLKRGAYKNIAEFNANQPSITDSFYVDSIKRTDFVWSGTYSLVPRYFTSDKKIKDIWGFSDGTHSYIYHQLDFFRLENENGEWSFVGFELVDQNGEVVAAFTSAAIGGLVGGVLGQLAYSHDMKMLARKKKIRYTLEPSGQIIHPTIYIPYYPGQKGNRINIYRRSKNEIEIPLTLIVNKNLKYSFVPNSFQSYYFDTTKTTVKVYYGDSLSLDVKLKKNESIYLQCSFVENGKMPQLIEVDYEKGKYDSFKPEKAQKKRDFKAFEAKLNTGIENRVRVIFYRNSKNEWDEPLEVLLDDSLRFSFEPNSYKSFTFTTYKSAIEICSGLDFSQCNTIDVTDGETIYIECSQLQKENKPKVVKVATKKGKYDSFKPEKAQRKKDNLN